MNIYSIVVVVVQSNGLNAIYRTPCAGFICTMLYEYKLFVMPWMANVRNPLCSNTDCAPAKLSEVYILLLLLDVNIIIYIRQQR